MLSPGTGSMSHRRGFLLCPPEWSESASAVSQKDLVGGYRCSSSRQTPGRLLPASRPVAYSREERKCPPTRSFWLTALADSLRSGGQTRKSCGLPPGNDVYAPLNRDTSGRLTIRERSSCTGRVLISSTVTARLRSKRPDCVRRRFFKCAPHPSSAPMSWAYVRT